MALVVPRILYDNLVASSSTVLSASSYELGYEPSKLEDQARGRRYRTKTGWTIVPGFNDALIHTADAENNLLGYIAPGTYATGSAMATAVQSALNNAGVHPITNLNVTGWWRADSVVLDSDGRVSQLTDLSGNGRHFLQATAGLRPLWVANALDGRPGLYYDGARSMATSVAASTLFGAASGTVAIVFRLDADAAGADDELLRVAGGADYFVMAWAGGANFSTYVSPSAGTATRAAAAGGVDKWHTFVARYGNGSGVFSYVDNVDDAASGSCPMTANLSATTLASVVTLGGVSLKGYIVEAMIMPAWNEAVRRGMEAYFKARYPSQAANDASGAPGYTVTWSASYGSTTKKFTVAKSGGAGNITLRASTGTPAIDLATSAFPDLGFTATQKTGATTYTAENVAYMSRHYIKVDLATARAILSAIVLDHNAGASGGTFTLEGNADDLWVAPTHSQALTGDAAQRSAYFASSSLRWRRLIINDVQNSAGYSEIGVWFVGPYLQPQGYANTFKPGYEDLSAVTYGTYGASHLDERPQFNTFALMWRNLSDADDASFETFRVAVPVGARFFLALDAVVTPTRLFYVSCVRPLDTTHVPGVGWNKEMVVREELP